MNINSHVVPFLIPAILLTLTHTAIAESSTQTDPPLATQPSFLADSVLQENTPASALLNEILLNPGQWNQMCNIPRFPSPDFIPLFGYTRNPMDFISKANFERLRAQRPEVLAEISRRITGLIPSETERLRTTTATRQERQDPETGQTYTIQVGMGESDTPLEKYLVMILDLNGIETLPTLLELEAALNVIAPYQNIPASETDTTDDSDGAPQLRVAETANITHARVLSIVTALLLNENHAIFRNSEFYKRYESEYAAAYAHYASTGKLNERWQPDKSAPARTADLAGFLARRDESWDGSDNHFMMPYNAANRHEIVRLARRFLDEVSPADYVAAGAMAEKLRYR